MDAGSLERPHRSGRYAFWGLVALVVAIGVGHLYVLSGLTALVLGLPLWLWLQLGVVAAMLGLAWVALSIRRPEAPRWY